MRANNVGFGRQFSLAAAFAASLLVPGAALAAPGDLVIVHGTVIERHGNTLILRSDNGRTYYADVSSVDPGRAAALRHGDQALIRGTEGTYPNEIRVATAELRTAQGRLPAVATVVPAAPEVLPHRDWRLPVTHRYETFDRPTGIYVPVDVASVPARIERGEWIYDRSAGQWVFHPTTGRNAAYLTAGPGSVMVLPATDPRTFVYRDWRLPRDHRYQTYNPTTGKYDDVAVEHVPSHIERGEWIYDRTVSLWVSHGGMRINPAYLERRIHGTVQSAAGNTIEVVAEDGSFVTVDTSQVLPSPPVGVAVGDRVGVIGSYQGGKTFVAHSVERQIASAPWPPRAVITRQPQAR